MGNNIRATVTNFDSMFYDFGFRRGLSEVQKILTDKMVQVSRFNNRDSRKEYKTLEDLWYAIKDLESEWDKKQNYYEVNGSNNEN